MKKKHVVVASTMMLTAFLGGCSSSPDKISAQYVSPLMYQPYDCDQIGMELRRVNSRLIEVTGAQESEANKDAVATGVGLVLFWPALFFLAGDDRAAELGRLKGEYEALELAAIQKRCDIIQELKEAREERKRREKEAKEKLQACLRPRDRFWDIPVPKIDSAFDNLLVPQPSWSPSTAQQLRKLVAAPYLSPT